MTYNIINERTERLIYMSVFAGYMGLKETENGYITLGNNLRPEKGWFDTVEETAMFEDGAVGVLKCNAIIVTISDTSIAHDVVRYLCARTDLRFELLYDIGRRVVKVYFNDNCRTNLDRLKVLGDVRTQSAYTCDYIRTKTENYFLAYDNTDDRGLSDFPAELLNVVKGL